MSDPHRRSLRMGGAVAASMMLVATTAIPGASGQTPPPEPCPEPFPTDELSEGMTATGLTVERGSTADEFSATVIGVLDDGIGPGADMIIVETDSPAIDRAGGIWAGMSGSPVYASDGRMIGAVSYGFSASPSPVAGLTPAADMYELFERYGPTAQETREAVSLPHHVQRELVSSGAAEPGQARAGLQRLPLPMAVSGVPERRIDDLVDRLNPRAPAAVGFPGAAAPDQQAPTGDIVPGGNVAAALSYGDVTTASVGTATAVCEDDRVVAFGHPVSWSGAAPMSMHPAEAVLVQRDDTFGPFKLANPAGIAGTFRQDRLAGTSGTLGEKPETVPVRSAVTVGETERTGLTQVVARTRLPDLTSSHLLSNVDAVMDSVGPGVAKLRWTIEGTRDSGEPFTVDAVNMYADRADIAFAVAADPSGQLRELQDNEFEDVTVTGVDLEADVSAGYARYSVASVAVRAADAYQQPLSSRPVPVVAGGDVDLRVDLEPYQGVGDPRSIELTVHVPDDAAGQSGRIEVRGGAGAEPGEWGEPEESHGERAGNFDELLANLEGIVPNHAVTSSLMLQPSADAGMVEVDGDQATSDGVAVGSVSFDVEVVDGAAPRSASAFR